MKDVSKYYNDTIGIHHKSYDDLVNENKAILHDILKNKVNFLDIRSKWHGEIQEQIDNAAGFISTVMNKTVRCITLSTPTSIIPDNIMRQAVLRSYFSEGILVKDADKKSTCQISTHIRKI